MSQLSQVLSFLGGLRKIPDVQGSQGELSVKKYVPVIENLVQNDTPLTLFVGATGCGKSKVLPEKFASFVLARHRHAAKVLVLTSAARDVKDMHRWCGLRSHWRTGNRQQGGSFWFVCPFRAFLESY